MTRPDVDLPGAPENHRHPPTVQIAKTKIYLVFTINPYIVHLSRHIDDSG
jgi:hypothetical protein